MESQPVRVIDLMFFWRLIKRFWILIAICAVVGAITGYVLAKWVIKPTYQATALVFACSEQLQSSGFIDELEDSLRNENLSPEEERKLRQEINTTRLRNMQQMNMQVNVGNLMMPDFQALLNSKAMCDKINAALPKDAKFLELMKKRGELSQDELIPPPTVSVPNTVEESEASQPEANVAETVQEQESDAEVADNAETPESKVEVADNAETPESKVEVADNAKTPESKVEVADNAKTPERKFPIPSYQLLVTPLPKTRFVEISVRCHDKELAPIIINVAVEEFKKEAKSILGMEKTEVIDPALDASRVAPSVSRFTLFGFLIGFLLSGGFAFAVVFFDKSIGDLKELEERVKLPVLGVLPEVTIGSGNDAELWQQNNKSVYGEAIRALRVNVEYLLPENGRAKLFLITSVNKGDGKSSIISSLAVALACLEKKVLLIDMDLRRPRQHRIFRLPNQDGLVDMLVSKKTFNELLHHNVKVPGLDVLTSGTVPLTPTDLLASPRLENFLKEQAQNYDYIFMDAPPVLGLADPLILGKLADATIFACDFKSANVDKLRNVTERLRQAEIKLAGLVLNRFSLQGKSDYYYYYQHYYYGYHYNYASESEGGDEIAEIPDKEKKNVKDNAE